MRKRYCFLFFVAAHAAGTARGTEVGQSDGPQESTSQAASTSQMQAYITAEASVLCWGKAFGTYPHPTDKACQITCYGSDGQPGSSDAIGHKECCSPGLCYMPASDLSPSSCAPCSAGESQLPVTVNKFFSWPLSSADHEDKWNRLCKLLTSLSDSVILCTPDGVAPPAYPPPAITVSAPPPPRAVAAPPPSSPPPMITVSAPPPPSLAPPTLAPPTATFPPPAPPFVVAGACYVAGGGSIVFNQTCWSCEGCTYNQTLLRVGTSLQPGTLNTTVAVLGASGVNISYDLSNFGGRPNSFRLTVQVADPPGVNFSASFDSQLDMAPYGFVPRSFVVTLPPNTASIYVIFTERQDTGYWLIRDLQVTPVTPPVPGRVPYPPPPPVLTRACYGVGAGVVNLEADCWVCVVGCFFYGGTLQIGGNQTNAVATAAFNTLGNTFMSVRYDIMNGGGPPNSFSATVSIPDGPRWSVELEAFSDSDPFPYATRRFHITPPASTTLIITFQAVQQTSWIYITNLEISPALAIPPSPPPPPPFGACTAVGGGVVPFTQPCWVCEQNNCFLFNTYGQFGTAYVARSSYTSISLNGATSFNLQYDLENTEGGPNSWEARLELADGPRSIIPLESFQDSPAFVSAPRKFPITIPSGASTAKLVFVSRQDPGFWVVRNLQAV